MSELEDHQDFLRGLHDPTPPAVKTRAKAPPKAPPPDIDAGAAHLVAAFTDLRFVVVRLHADMTQQMRSMEVKVEAGFPDREALTKRLLKVAENAGGAAAYPLAQTQLKLVEESKEVTRLRRRDQQLFRNLALWVALPAFLIGLFLVVVAADNRNLAPAWAVTAAYLFGVVTTFLCINMIGRFELWLKERQWRKGQGR